MMTEIAVVVIPRAEMVIHETIVVPQNVKLVGEVTVRTCDCCDWEGKAMIETFSLMDPLYLPNINPVHGFTLLNDHAEVVDHG